MGPRPRARELGLDLPGRPGPHNAITDVPGVAVGQATIRELASGPAARQVLTGVTAVLPRGHAPEPLPVHAGQFTFNGNGEMTGTHWIRDAGGFLGPVCLTNTHSVGVVHHAAVRWMIDRYPRHFREHHAWAMPVVAETYDGLVSDICGLHVTERHALEALATAAGGRVAEGNVGGGAGNQTYDFKGGTGTSSRCVATAGAEYTVGVLVQSNFGTRAEFAPLGVPASGRFSAGVVPIEAASRELGSIIVVIATDAPLNATQLARVARRGALGIGRTGTSGGHSSGDLMLAFSVANGVPLPAIGEPQPARFAAEWLNDALIDPLYAAVVQATEEAVLNALVAAESVPTLKPRGHVLEAIDTAELVALLRAHGRA